MRYNLPRITGAALLLGMGGLLLGADGSASAPAPVKAAVMSTFFTDVPTEVSSMITKSFGAVVSEATGLACHFDLADDALTTAARLDKGEIHFGIFHGVEFAWAEQKHPDLAPLMLAIGQPLRALLVVNKQSDISSAAHLAAKDVALPKKSEKHCRLFVHSMVKTQGRAGKVVESENAEAALDALSQNKVDAAVVSARALEFYRDLKPGCCAKLKVVSESEEFPPHVIAHRPGMLDEAKVQRVRQGLAQLSQLPKGRELLKLWRVERFEAPGASFGQSLAAIHRTYPAP
jgi:ABC-type phosphate/phosphonate transport system substrate-binding protein